MTILKSSHPSDAKINYRLTHARTRKGMKEAPENLSVAAYAIYSDVNKASGEVITLAAIADNNGDVYCTNSPTFIDDFEAIVEAFPDIEEIFVVKAKSKKGREFITCTIRD